MLILEEEFSRVCGELQLVKEQLQLAKAAIEELRYQVPENWERRQRETSDAIGRVVQRNLELQTRVDELEYEVTRLRTNP